MKKLYQILALLAVALLLTACNKTDAPQKLSTEHAPGLMATLDPKRDTPEALGKYVPAFHPAILGLYADEQTTGQTAKDFKLFYQKQKPDFSGFYMVDHMGLAYMFDPQGRLRLFASDQLTAEAIAHDSRTLLKARG